ncbi:hypothetical protein P5G51_002690 [Virgibacillus sp. 179-BFC.A HS]|uniref:Uncharacterized protein n=1 Tax=Tigheibacillus jepli TaxID=3035914 RepID=A0ABU5CDP2_9BACI|nr:hypothetical protein [Virgibacillus sp. 179-BFC.A HS]MDY0404462.1 hypothetical protein [Virgibacillus sp. 179-BFC.A HS]
MEDVFLADGLMTKERAKGFATEKAPQAELEDLDFSFVQNGEKHG